MSSLRLPAAHSRLRLIRTASLIAVATALTAGPAEAQLARIRGGVETLGNASGTRPAGGIVRPGNMREALAQQQSTQARAAQIRSFVTSARQAAAASVARITPTNGIGPNGLYPIQAIRDAMQARDAGDQATVDITLVGTRAANDRGALANGTIDRTQAGKNTWDGAGLPVQTADAAGTTVSITQTQSRTVLSWDRFDVGAGTTVQFNQKQGGVAQRDWIAVNRVVAGTDPTTILGKINADGQVFVLNRNGVIFGKGAQLNLGSLLASSLELGNYADNASFGGGARVSFRTLDRQQRNLAFLRNGLLQAAPSPTLSQPLPPLLLSPQFAQEVIEGDRNTAVTFPVLEGDVIVDPGASITTLSGGSIILAAPRVDNSGILQAADGQVSLVGGRLVTYATMTGEESSRDPNVRGLFLRALPQVPSAPAAPAAPADPVRDRGIVLNNGLVESRRGYLSLVTTPTGEIVNDGLLTATTSVSRNGKIALYGGTVRLGGAADRAQAGAITILPDESSETIPQGSAAEPPRFKRSQIEIGAAVSLDEDQTNTVDEALDAIGQLTPSIVAFGQNALVYAPNANVVIGRRAGDSFNPASAFNVPSRIDILDGALIDVSGLKDVALDNARNFLTITPAKRNELRDTPNYREVVTGGEFSLNGKTLTVDIRRSGVRADGVRWVGSPLLEAGSLASQIAIRAAELMTKAGDVSLVVNPVPGTNVAAIQVDPSRAPAVSIRQGATIDISGGWVSYSGGPVGTSRLRTVDGRIVDIGDADPNDAFAAVVEGFTANQPRFGISDQFATPITAGTRVEAGYDEGRDGGSLLVNASAVRFDGAIRAAAFAGDRQRSTASAPSLPSTLLGDTRSLQRVATELPVGGLLQIAALSGGVAELGSDIRIARIGSVAGETPVGTTILSDLMLSAARLSGLTLRTTGAVSFDKETTLSLAAGGALTVEAGRQVKIAGAIRVPGGKVDIRTSTFGQEPGILSVPVQLGLGSVFTPDDDLFSLYADRPARVDLFDVTVAGSISTAGLWTNDSRSTDFLLGPGWKNGGSIRLEVAPRVIAALGSSVTTAQDAVDLSGALRIEDKALLDVSAGGYASIDERLDLSGAAGSIALVNTTSYASVRATDRNVGEGDVGTAQNPLNSSSTNQTIGFTPITAGAGDAILPRLVPSQRRAEIFIADGAMRAFGFSEGGHFELVAPDITFGSDARRDGAVHIGFDFTARHGFGSLDLTSNRTRFVSGLFDNQRANVSSFRETTSFRVRSGETLSLTQTLLPLVTSRDDVTALLSLPTGGSLLDRVSPVVPAFAIDRRAIDLRIGGLGELIVDAGGAIIGEPGATITAPKIVNSGRIVLPGGTLKQEDISPSTDATNRALGLRSLTALLGAESGVSETALNVLELSQDGRILTNAEVFNLEGGDRLFYLLGEGEESVGIRLGAGSVTDLSGTAIFDPRARFFKDVATNTLRQERIGRLIEGGTIATTSTLNDQTGGQFSLFSRTMIADSGSVIDLSGTRGTFDEFVPGAGYVATEQWSAGGRLSLLSGGGTIAGARINAFGGYGEDGGTFHATGKIVAAALERRALGGTLEWNQPTIAAAFPKNAANVLVDTVIEEAGFDTLIARGGLRLDGAVDLTLGKGLFVTAPVTRTGVLPVVTSYMVSATAGTRARLAAPYIAFASRARNSSVIQGAADEIEGDKAAITFEAGAQGIDLVGATLFGASIGTLAFRTDADIRFIGVDTRTDLQRQDAAGQGTLNGDVVSFADMTFAAACSYATTGTGNLQAFVDAERTTGKAPVSTGVAFYAPYAVSALGDRTIRFERTRVSDEAPLSAGSYVRVLATRIEQNGHLATPLGRLELGAAPGPASALITPTESVTFGAGSLTSVAGGATPVPYGTTLDLREYYFSPLGLNPLSGLPTSEMRLTAGTVDVAQGARIDLSGGGDVFAYEFVSGVGGSRDVLDRFNTDAFSSNGFEPARSAGLQYADGRQVYALIPAAQAKGIADFDPIYSADYGANGPVDLYGAQAGLSVILDGSAGGVPAGEYLLLPAHYALLPGAFRVVENLGDAPPAPGAPQILLDGSIVVGGRYATKGAGREESLRRSFTVQSPDTFRKYARIETRSGSNVIADQAKAGGKDRPRLPIDAARLVLSPFEALRVSGLFDTAAAAGGRGAQVDINAADIVIARQGSAPVEGAVTLIDTALNALNAESLYVGGVRIGNADGTTDLRVTARRLDVLEGVDLFAPELLLTVGNERENGTIGGSRLNVASGARLRAEGDASAAETSDYVIQSFAAVQGRVVKGDFFGDGSGSGSALRVANGPERLVRRTGPGYERDARTNATFQIGDAILQGENVVIESTRLPRVLEDVDLRARNVALIGDDLQFGKTITPLLESKLAASQRLTLRSPDAIGFVAGTHQFNDLTIDAPAIEALSIEGETGDVALAARSLRLVNIFDAGARCFLNCGNVETDLSIQATEISFGTGDVRAYGFGGNVRLAATQGMFYEGTGSLDVGTGRLTLATPILADHSALADPRAQKLRPDYRFASRFSIAVQNEGGTAPNIASVAGNRAPGAQLHFGGSDAVAPTLPADELDIRIDNALVLATAGSIGIEAARDVTLTGGATLATPGFTKTFGDVLDNVTVAASGGRIDMLARQGSIRMDTSATLISDTGIGAAGAVRLRAPSGEIALGRLNPELTGTRANDFWYDAGAGGFDLTGFLASGAARFQGQFVVRTGSGDLTLATGTRLRAESASLTADGGTLTIAGTIDTSGASVAGLSLSEASKARVDGGDVELYGRNGVTLTSTALLDTHTTGYADADPRSAAAGDISIGIAESGARLVIDTGARLDLGARRSEAAVAQGLPGARLVAETVKAPGTLADTIVYRLVEADSGGLLSLRAPLIGAGTNQVDISIGAPASISGAREVQVEAFLRYDLDKIIDSSGAVGLDFNADGTGLQLDPSANFLVRDEQNQPTPYVGNFLSTDFVTEEGLRSVPNFIRTFNATAADGTAFDDYRVRPGVELVTSRSLALISQWNLAAADIDFEGALAAGVVETIDRLGRRLTSYGLTRAGDAYYNVVGGQEGALLDGFANFYYRTDVNGDARGDARGEAPVLRFRSGGDLRIERTISDGFFVFRDRSDQAYVEYQLGGGLRRYMPALQLSCGLVADGLCSPAPRVDGSYKADEPGLAIFGDVVTAGERNARSVRININNVLRGLPLDTIGQPAPLGPEANSPAALGTQADPLTGDLVGASMEFGELFPLLAGDVAMRSSDISLVGGATLGTSYSANPDYAFASSAADVAISDARMEADGSETRWSYRLQAARATPVIAGDQLLFRFFKEQDGEPIFFDLNDLLGQDRSGSDYAIDELTENSFTLLNWGQSNQNTTNAAIAPARDFFQPRGRTFLGSVNRPTGVLAPLGEVLQFLEGLESTYLTKLYAGEFQQQLSNPPGTTAFEPSARAQVQTAVRTGAGRITTVASRDADLRGGTTTIYRTDDGAIVPRNGGGPNVPQQVGGTSIYSAGQRVAQQPIKARLPDGQVVQIGLTSAFFTPGPENVGLIPTPNARTEMLAVIAQGGGDVRVSAGRDVLGRRDFWSENFRNASGFPIARFNEEAGTGLGIRPSSIGTGGQIWRVGTVGADTQAAIAPQYFTAGVGALAGGDVRIEAGRDVSDLTVALDTSIVSENATATRVLVTWGAGDLSVSAGRDIAAGRFDVASGQAFAETGRNFAPVTTLLRDNQRIDPTQFRLENATLAVRAGNLLAMDVGPLGVAPLAIGIDGSAGLYSQITGATAVALGNVSFGGGPYAPPSLELASLTGDISFARSTTLYPSPIGQFSLLAAGDIRDLSVAMLDVDPSLLAESAFASGLNLRSGIELAGGFPGVNLLVDEGTRRLYHNDRLTHADDARPATILAGGSIVDTSINLPKFAKLVAGEDIIDMFFVGQNLNASDETRIAAGRDIMATARAPGATGANQKPYFGANGFYLGGPGRFSVEAGRNIGPFITSAVIDAFDPFGKTIQIPFGGGIMTVGNEYNPWLPTQGADLNIQFGTGPGMDLEGLREIYLNPANFAKLDGDLFVQVTDQAGNERPDRARQVYAPILARWLRENEPGLFADALGQSSFVSEAALETAAYGQSLQLYGVFKSLPLNRQRDFLIDDLYFGELAQPATVGSPSFEQYIRGYRAIQALFPTRLGYTDNLAAYETPAGTITDDNPLGVPVRKQVNGDPVVADRVETGNADVRLATFQTARGGDIRIIAPGGDFLAGSVVRTSEQLNRRGTRFLFSGIREQVLIEFGGREQRSSRINAIPLGLEGILTLRSGQIRSFTDGDLRLNQSRMFTNGGGDILAWSSNGDLNAGQGPKSAASFPPVTVRFTLNGFPQTDTAAGIAGAGIGAFKNRPEDPASSIALIAPVGEVDAGDAGIRASGTLVVLANSFANRDAASAGGGIIASGNLSVSAPPPPPSSAASQVAAQVARIADQGRNDDRRSVIVVDVLGFAGGEQCRDPNSDDPNCPK